MSFRKFVRENYFTLLLMLLCAVGMTVTTVIFKQSWLRVGPIVRFLDHFCDASARHSLCPLAWRL